jgi:hypothetical protein
VFVVESPHFPQWGGMKNSSTALDQTHWGKTLRGGAFQAPSPSNIYHSYMFQKISSKYPKNR